MPADQFLDALLSLPKLGGAIISPDGAWAAWTWAGVGPTANIYAAPTDGSASPIRLTTSDQDVFPVSWAPDSRSVVVEQSFEGDERAQLFRVEIDRPEEMVALTESSPPYFLRGGELHPDGRRLIYAMNYDVDSGTEIEATWLYRHDLDTGERRVLARPARAAWYVPDLNDTGTHVLYQRQDLDPAGSQTWMVDIDGRADREILNFGADVKVSASWFPDARRVLFLAEAGTYRRLGVWEMETSEIRWLIDDPERNIEIAFAPRGTDGSLVVVAEIKEARIRASLLDADTGEERTLPERPGNWLPLRPSKDGAWVGEYYRSTQPVDLVRYHPETSETNDAVSLTGVWDRTSLSREDLTPAEDFRWTSVDDLPIQGWLYRAKGRPKGTIVHVHGGPTAHSEDVLNPSVQFFVHEGFNVLTPNYRGSTGFGLVFEESIKEDGWGGREQDDISTGVQALIDAGIAEAGKVGITGTSYGGYSSWCAITHCPRSIIAASAPICGMTDLVVDYETTRPDLRPYSEEMMGGTPEEMPDRYRERSPINFVRQIEGRLLIVQGARDPNVTPENVAAVRKALDDVGVAYDVLVFDDEGHGIRRPKNQRVLYRCLADFFGEAFS